MTRQSRHQAQILDEGVEIAVAVEQGVAMFDTARGDQGVDGLSHRHPQFPQLAVIARRLQGHIAADQGNDRSM